MSETARCHSVFIARIRFCSEATNISDNEDYFSGVEFGDGYRLQSRDFGGVLQARQHHIGFRGWHEEDGTVDAEGLILLDGLLAHGRAEDADGDSGAPGVLREPLQLFDAAPEAFGLTEAADRHPLVAVLDDVRERVRSVAADEHRRLRLLHGLWPRPDRIKVDVFAVKLGGVFGPDLL